MITLQGTGAVEGISLGTISFLRKPTKKVNKVIVTDTAFEIARFEKAKVATYEKIKSLYNMALEEVGESVAMIFEIHMMMLEDPDFCEFMRDIIETQQVNAEYAVSKATVKFSRVFAAMNDAYLQERAEDVKDVAQSIMESLAGKENSMNESVKGSVFAADSLVPSEVIRLVKANAKGFVIRYGSVDSHATILAKALKIPCIICVGDELREEYDLMEVIIDGATGGIIIDPNQATIKQMTQKKRDYEQKELVNTEMMGKKTISKDGQEISLYANIGNVEDIELVQSNDADGIGLFRSEFLYTQSNHYPTEMEQFHAYRAVVQRMKGKSVVFRTLDIGGEKDVDYFGLPQEENPALGFRAIRISLSKPQLFKTQLRALYRASAFGDISVMFPMIISVAEVREIKKLAKNAMDELSKENVKFDEHMQLGVMVETPAAVLMSDELSKEVDFFSIGANDLIRYTLAVDNQNQLLDRFYNPYHPAIFRQIKIVSDNAHANNIRVGVIGEIAADPQLTAVFLTLGIDGLVVPPSRILPLRNIVRQTNVSEVKESCYKKFMPANYNSEPIIHMA